MRYPSRLPFVLVTFVLTLNSCRPRSQVSDSALQSDSGENYSGKSPWRLIYVNRQGPNLDFNANLIPLNPKDVENDRTLSAEQKAALLQKIANESAQERLLEAARKAALTALIPIVGFEDSKNKTSSNADFLQSMMIMANNVTASMHGELQRILNGSKAQFPIVSEVFLVPWGEERQRDLFYSSDKISMSATELTNVIGASVGSEKFAGLINEGIRKLQTNLFNSSQEPAFLLAGRQTLFAAPGKSRLTLRLLVGLKDRTDPFTKEDPKVKFERVVIPSLPGSGITASVLIDINLADVNESPTMTVDFGAFDQYQNGNFTISKDNRQKLSPRLEGKVNKPGASVIGLNFAFMKLEFNLRTAQLSNLKTLLSAGFAVKNSNWVAGAFHVESVNKAFQEEINRTIDGEIKSAMKRASDRAAAGQLGISNDKILDGTMSNEIMELAFSRIFGRGA